MSATSFTRRDILATAASTGAASVLPIHFAAAADERSIRPFRVSVPEERTCRSPPAHRSHAVARAGDRQ